MILFLLGRRFGLCLAAAALAVLAAGGFLVGRGIAATAVGVAVTIDNFAFGPGTLRVTRGATVTWRNDDDEPHTVVSAADPKLWRSPALDTGESFSFVFADPGSYKYFCSVHPYMQGTVIVE